MKEKILIKLKKLTFVISILISFVIGFIFCSSISIINAKQPSPSMGYSGDIDYKRVYVNGRYFIVFYSDSGISAVKNNKGVV